MEKFLKRHKFSYRRRTTTAQKPPINYAQIVAKFIVYVEQRRKKVQFAQMFAMDETRVELDCPGNRTIEKTGAKDVS